MFALALIPLVGIGIWVMTQHALRLTQGTHYRRLQNGARNLVCSGQAWAQLHQAQIVTAPPGQVWELDLSELETARGSCRVKIISRTSSACTLEITAVSRSGAKSWVENRTMVLVR